MLSIQEMDILDDGGGSGGGIAGGILKPTFGFKQALLILDVLYVSQRKHVPTEASSLERKG